MIYGLCFLFILSTYTLIIMPHDYAESLHHTMWATFLQKENKLKEADNWYQTIIKQPTSLYSLKGYILFLAETGDYAKIASYIPTYEKKFAEDPVIQSMFAHALAYIGRQQESDDYFIRIHKQFPANQDIAFQTVQALVRQKKIEEALTIAQAIVNKSVSKHGNFIFYFLQSQLLIQLGKLEEARTAAQECLSLHPQFFKAWLLLGLVEEQLGNIDKAIQGYSSFLQTSNQRNAQIEQHILALTLKQSGNQLVPIPGRIQKPSLEQAALLFKQKRYKQALASIDRCIKDNPRDPRNTLFKLQILVEIKHYDEALALITNWIKQEPTQQLWFSAFNILFNLKVPKEKIINALLSLQKQMPQNQWPPLYLAHIYMNIEAYDDVLKQLDRASTLVQDPLLKTDIYFQMALINYEQRAFDRIDPLLEKGITQQSTHAPLFNMAAYFYATKGKNIEKAESLIAQALRLEPNNQHFLDTRAVILYKQGAYDKAELLLSGLLAQIEQDATIMLNLAKAKYKLDKKEEAHALVQRARSLVHNTHEQTTLKKLEQKWQLQ